MDNMKRIWKFIKESYKEADRDFVSGDILNYFLMLLVFPQQ